ncbi:MAG: hypothetical protein EXS10_08260 [Phycisphaerales bacterium]|nr:hypothetical protein [Phycisphaerales bacterium]
MSHPKRHDPRSPLHITKLFALYAVLFTTLAAFAMLITQVSLEGDHYIFVGIVLFLAAVAAAMVTSRHARAGHWDSTDDMAERMTGGKS